MNRLILLRRALAVLTVCVMAAGAFSASADNIQTEQTETETNADDNSGDGEDPTFDVSIYTEKLAEIAEDKERIDSQLAEADKGVLDETAKQQLILEKIDNLNQKSEVVNAYMTQLELEISTERRQADKLKEEVDNGIADYKKRLRAMYIAGDMSYTEVILNSGDFFDVLMRSELLKRVADYDARTLDSLVKKKAKYDKKTQKLKDEQAIYDEQAAQLDSEKVELLRLYNSTKETKALYQQQKEKLAEEQRVHENELNSFEGILSDLLKGSYGSSEDEIVRLQTELDANTALIDLHKSISERKSDGEVIPDSECQYDFGWPVPDHYYVSSGVGARWGSYHTGLDIPGDSGMPVLASEAGEVVRTNNSCTHNYGKNGGSCGCGGGYGNFVIIDHGNGFLTLYGHFTQTTVEVGDKVKKGDVVGLMGTTGFSTGTHLHFELRYGGYITNPASFVSY